MKLLCLCLVILLTGCVSKLQDGQSISDTGTVLGMHLDIPIPFAQNVSIATIKIGYINNNFHMGNNARMISVINHKDIELLKGKGTVEKLFAVGYKKNELKKIISEEKLE